MNSKSALKQAIKICGGQIRAAELINEHLPKSANSSPCDQQKLSFYLADRCADGLAPQYAIPLEIAVFSFRGAKGWTPLTRWDFRPDVFGDKPAGQEEVSMEVAES